MSKNILVISSSLRGGSNSDILADEFIRGAREAGNKVEKISLRGKKINFCIGCLACQQTGSCVAADTEQTAAEGPLKGLQGWIDCFEQAELKGVVCGLGAEKPGDVKAMPAMAEAYELGRKA